MLKHTGIKNEYLPKQPPDKPQHAPLSNSLVLDVFSSDNSFYPAYPLSGSNACNCQYAIPIQRMSIDIVYKDGTPPTKIESAECIKSELAGLLRDVNIHPSSKEAIQAAIDRGEVLPEEFDVAYGHLSYINDFMPSELGSKQGTGWLRNITGGGASTLTGKRTAAGDIKEHMQDREYDALKFLSEKFYETADNLQTQPKRTKPIFLYRGFRTEHITDTDEPAILEKIRRFNDRIPSSASWNTDTPIHMSKPDPNQDSVLLRLEIEPDFPIICLSYPDNGRRTGSAAPAIDIGQAEVLIGAYQFKDLRLSAVDIIGESSNQYTVDCSIIPDSPQAVNDRIVAASPYLQEEKRQEEERRLAIEKQLAEGQLQKQAYEQRLAEEGLVEIRLLPSQLKTRFDASVEAEILATNESDHDFMGKDGKKYKLIKIGYIRIFLAPLTP